MTKLPHPSIYVTDHRQFGPHAWTGGSAVWWELV